MAGIPTNVAGFCAPGTSLMNSDEASECHPGVPENVYFWHFKDANDMAAAFSDVNTELGVLTPVDGDCHLLWNGQGTYSENGIPAGRYSCPDDGPSDIPLLYKDGQFFTWTDDNNFIIGVVSEPNALAPGLYTWWLDEMRGPFAG
jgi:hypothetical protein